MSRLVIVLLALILFASCIVFASFRQKKIHAFLFSLIFVCFVTTMYGFYGGFSSIYQQEQQKKQQILVKKAMKELKTPERVISRMKETLEKHPDSAKGWYLLGRIYSSQSEFKKASLAFRKAYRLDKNNLQTQFELMQSLYLVNHQSHTKLSQRLLKEMLARDPNQPDVLNFMAIDAYTHKHYGKASKIWQKLLVMIPKYSKEHDMLLQAIARAQKANIEKR